MTLDNSSDEKNEEGIDLQLYLSLFWHWAWLILMVTVIAGGVTNFLSHRMTPYYRSTTTLLVNAAPSTKATDYTSVMLSEQLTSTYSTLMVKDNVLKEVATVLGLTNSLQEIKGWITVSPITNTQLISLITETTDPILSANVANTIATVFAAQIQEIQTQRFSQSMATLELQMADAENQITTYETQANTALSQEEINRFDSKAMQYRDLYSSLLQSYQQAQISEAQSVSSVVQADLATPNLNPVKPKVMQNTLLAAMVAFFLMAGLIVAREALDDTIQTPEEITRKFKLPVLGLINHHNPEKTGPITMSDPRSPTAEAYRALRTNVNYTSVDKSLHTLLVTSAEPGEGKTTTIGNLATVLAQNGSRVIIVDCDLRRPRVHTLFGLNNRQGLSSLFTQPTNNLDGICQSTKLDNLTVVSSGLLPPNPAELLGSQKMQSILSNMQQSSDFVLLDTPPVLAVTDAAVLGPTLDGVILVVRPGKTRASALRQTLEQFHKVNAHVLGIVLNDIITRGGPYGYKYYRNYSAYQNYYGAKGKGKRK